MSILMNKNTSADGDTSLAEVLGVQYRIPRVNLLPPEIGQARKLKRTQGLLVAGVCVVLAGVGGLYVLGQQGIDDAQAELTTAQARTSTLQAEQAPYAEVPTVLAQVDNAELARESAMGNDILWYQYLGDLAATYPPDVWLGNLTATVAGPGAVAPAAVDTTGLMTPGVGTVTFTGTALAHVDVAGWLEVLGATHGFADATFSSSQVSQIDGKDVVEFTSSVVVTPEALSGRFDRKAP